MAGKKTKKPPTQKAASAAGSQVAGGSAEPLGSGPESVSDTPEVMLSMQDGKHIVVEPDEEIPFDVLYMVYQVNGVQETGKFSCLAQLKAFLELTKDHKEYKDVATDVFYDRTAPPDAKAGARPQRTGTSQKRFFKADENYLDKIRLQIASLTDPASEHGTNPPVSLSPWRIAWEKASWLHGEGLLIDYPQYSSCEVDGKLYSVNYKHNFAEFSPDDNEPAEGTAVTEDAGDVPPEETGPRPLKAKKGAYARVSAGSKKKVQLSKNASIALEAMSKTTEIQI
eukprot:gene5198-5268_t